MSETSTSSSMSVTPPPGRSSVSQKHVTFVSWERMGVFQPPEDKDAALFPTTFGGRWALIHRPAPAMSGLGAHIWISFSPDLRHWGDARVLLAARHGGWWDANKVGLGPPPLLTKNGWLICYHAVRVTAAGSIYRLGLALLDREDPTIVLARANEWVFGPQAPYERSGDVPDVVFPCGWILREDGDTLHVYYGASDSVVCVAVLAQYPAAREDHVGHVARALVGSLGAEHPLVGAGEHDGRVLPVQKCQPEAVDGSSRGHADGVVADHEPFFVRSGGGPSPTLLASHHPPWRAASRTRASPQWRRSGLNEIQMSGHQSRHRRRRSWISAQRPPKVVGNKAASLSSGGWRTPIRSQLTKSRVCGRTSGPAVE